MDGSTRKSYFCAHKRGDLPCPRGVPTLQEHMVDEWIVEHLGMLLEAEARQNDWLRSDTSGAPALAKLELKREALLKEGEAALAQLVVCLDPIQIRLVASALRKKREPVELQIEVLRKQVKAAQSQNPIAFDLKSLDKRGLKALLRQALRWVAVTTTRTILRIPAAKYRRLRFLHLWRQFRGFPPQTSSS